ncbi:3-oxoacyl-[acyl-carrier protein] reductase [Novosphingobium chloroacetimidivorans]|uniref:3-oxoacyl-[acyl-carrier protein] reductase n=1 Tax=Novosphingobium chloroacetimidivorans TaxID=1428314 RepID=A0A7W7KEK3_9SPHN|nr:SDR family oxidoreductase [Novosphingobium chloroacetimidivorans]MBB4860773.1 3-oxoacyl-[acyl-carrier protein] reductase [Novosphingobium chloroacetimidivorans]
MQTEPVAQEVPQRAIAQEFDLSGRTAVITGAASGIGRETARLLAQAGARTLVSDVNEDGLAETARLIGEAGPPAITQVADVSCRAEIEALADLALAETGRLDIWINVAGIIVHRPLLEAREDELDRLLAINLKGVYWGCVAAGRAMRRAGGSIVNLSSSGGETAVPGLSLYSMSKAAVNMLTRTVAKELGPFGIRANAIAPGWVETPMGLHSFRDASGAIDPDKRELGLQQRAQASPLGITGTTRDIALAALYLASDASRFMTGQILRPNGGVSMP